MGDYINVKEIFGCDVFNDSVMQTVCRRRYTAN